MKSYSRKLGFCAVATFGLAMTATFAACGNENTTEVSEQTGLDIIAKGDTLPKCDSDNAGDMVFVADSAAVYYCAGGQWATLNGKNGKDGEKGEKGESGAEGMATNGTSCTAKTVENGIEVSCDGKVVGTLKNGEPGTGTDGKSACALALGKDECSEAEQAVWIASLNGKDGKSCSATQNAAKTETTITCQVEDNKSVSYVVKNGENCATETNEDGSYTIKCAGSADVTIRNGTDGKSACALANGKEVECTADELAAWIKSLKGATGASGKSACALALGKDEECTDEEQTKWLASISQGVLKDSRDGQIYKTVTIGTQTWMAENLNFNSNFKDAENNDVINSWCYNEGKEGVAEDEYKKNCATYGRLYLWSAAMDSAAVFSDDGKFCGNYKNEEVNKCAASGTVRGVCPNGWHLPSYGEWDALRIAVGGSSVAGKMLKSASGWNSSGNGSDAYGFSALPVGFSSSGGVLFYNAGRNAYFWSASQYEDTSDGAYGMNLSYNYEYAGLDYLSKYDGRSVRCIKN